MFSSTGSKRCSDWPHCLCVSLPVLGSKSFSSLLSLLQSAARELGIPWDLREGYWKTIGTLHDLYLNLSAWANTQCWPCSIPSSLVRRHRLKEQISRVCWYLGVSWWGTGKNIYRSTKATEQINWDFALGNEVETGLHFWKWKTLEAEQPH